MKMFKMHRKINKIMNVLLHKTLYNFLLYKKLINLQKYNHFEGTYMLEFSEDRHKTFPWFSWFSFFCLLSNIRLLKDYFQVVSLHEIYFSSLT